MTALEAYKEFELKINGLDNSSNVDISPGEFIMLYNEQQPKWFSSKFEERSSRYAIDEVEGLVELDKTLEIESITGRYVNCKLPSNYFDHIKTHILASRASCTEKLLKTHEVKLLELESYLGDHFNSPSFDYRETVITFAGNKIQVYKTDFEVKSVLMTYYRYPVKIDIAGYKHVDGTDSSNVNPELPDEAVREVLDMCALEVQRTFQNVEGFQLSTDRVNRNK
jgi:hypothetical protein